MAKNKVVKAKSKWDASAFSFWGTVLLMVLIVGAFAAVGVAIAYKLGSFNLFGNSTPWYKDLMSLKVLAGFAALVVFAALGFCWACIIYIKWDTKHTVISGQRLKFKAGVWSFIFNCIKWTFITVITLGIYSLWVPVKARQWQVANTVSEAEEDEYGWAAPQITYYEYDEE